MAASIRRITAADVAEPPPGTYANCLIAGDTIYVSGMHAGGPEGVVGPGSVETQAAEAFRRIFALVAAAGGSRERIVKLTVYLTDVTKRPEVAAARRAFFGAHVPCSTLVEISALVEPELLVEIDAVAVL